MASKEIITKIKNLLPEEARISDVAFEGANIVLYSKNKAFVLNSKELLGQIVNEIKKRVEIRPDESLLEPQEFTEKFIRENVPADAEIGDVWFDEKRSLVIIEAGKPGSVIGKEGETIQLIKTKTSWVPLIRRKPVIKSDLIRNIRLTLYKNSNFRRKFLQKIGEKIYNPWERTNKYWVRVSCLGGFREVGRSCVLLQTSNSQVMLDCGINVASDDSAFPQLEAPEFDPKRLDAVIVTHAHLDHCGFVPYLFKCGYEGPVYCSEPTRDVMTLLQLDYIDISEKENKKMLYTSKEVKDMVNHTICLNPNEVTDITPDVRITLLNAGHILGSSLAHLNIGNGYHNLLYTGDLKFAQTQTLEPAVSKFQRVETLIMEGTYGGAQNIQPGIEESEAFLVKIVKETVLRRGKVLIPVLGVGRAQEVMVMVEELVRKKEIPAVPVIVDGIVWDITAIYTTYPEYFNKNIRNLIFQEGHNPFLNTLFKQPVNQKERLKIMEEEGPCVILATSGMLTGGPSMFYFERMADNPRNSLIFVSYQGKGSLGRILQRGDKEITIDTQEGRRLLKVNLEVYTIEGLSGHSDRLQLMNFVKYMSPKPKKIIINHGEVSNCLDLASSIYKKFGIETTAPKNLEVVRIG
ncbi:Ribonuclease J [Candidatus Tiddalikarchaeum anstoanum]|nr:Ribonuclease J [Candidatus Tiddalikarchaeum anstoanum]